MTHAWQLVASKWLFQTRYKKLMRHTFRTPDGARNDFDIAVQPRSVVVFILTTDNRVVLVEQFRPGPEKNVLDLVAGIIDRGETPSDAAVRETLEETGYRGTVQFLVANHQDPYSTGIVYSHVITDAQKIREPNPDTTEWIKVRDVSLQDFKKIVQRGGMCQASVATAYLSLQHLDLLK